MQLAGALRASPPAPLTRDSEIVDSGGNLLSNPSLYADTTVRIVASTNALLVGHVTWQGRPAQPSTLQQLPVTLTLKSGSTEVNYPAQSTNQGGQFTASLSTLPGGTYNWRAKGPKYLARGGTVSLNGSTSTSVEIGQMRTGDADDNNMVNAVDFIVLRAAFGKSQGEPGYDDRADFTGDNRVDIIDFVLLKINFGTGGAPPPAP
jgi:Dockerin type I domain